MMKRCSPIAACLILFLSACHAQLSTGGSLRMGGQLQVQGRPQLSITTRSLPNGLEGKAYSQTIGTINGTSPFTFSILSGSLPNGLSLNASTGAITGTPTTTGSFNFVIQVSDSSTPTQKATHSYTIPITCTPLGISTTTLPGGVTSAVYSFQVQSSGGVTPITWSLASGILPSGLSISSAGLISGTPTTVQTTTAQIQATDSCSPTPQVVSSSFALTITGPLVITTTSVPQVTEGVAYSTQFAAAGGTSPYTWTVSAGTLPAGLSLSSGGVLSGTATSAGTSSFTIQVHDAGSNATTGVFSIVVSCAPLSITTTALPAGAQGNPYSTQLNFLGGTGTVTWSLASGVLPSGLTISAAGVISGTPAQSGNFPITLQATDSCLPTSQTATVALVLSVTSQLTITTSAVLPGGVEGQSYSVQMSATGGTLPYAWSGSVPAGLTLTSAGLLSGTPTQAGTFSLSITVTDANSFNTTGAFTLQVNCPTLSIASTSPLPGATVGTPYSFQFQGSGGIPPYTWGIPPSGITTPPGIGLSPSGLLSGTPTTAGNFTPTIAVNDSCVPTSQQSASNFSISIAAAVSITTSSPLPAGTELQSYSQQMSASGGVPPYTWSVTSGALPVGLSLSSAGAITGTPTKSGTATATIKAQDTGSNSASGIFSITISCTPLSITTGTTLQGGTQNSAYSQQLQATGGTGSLSWTLVGGTLPSGVTLSSGGVISGTPTSSGTFSPVIQVADSCSPSAQTLAQAFSLTINPSTGTLAIVTTSPLPPATESQSYSFTMQASGGTPPYSWTTTAGSLPVGLALASSGAITGTPTTSGTASATIKVTDSLAANVSGAFNLTVSCVALSLTSGATLPPGTVGTAYSTQLASTGGTGALTWSVTAGSLPAGLTLSSSGLISGTPTASGTSTPTIRVMDSCSPTAQTSSVAFSITINKALAISTGANLPGAKELQPYTATLAATGGVTPYTWSIASGTLPAGLSLSTAGVISGSPSVAGTFTPTIKVTDSASNVATKAFSLTVTCTALTLTTTSPLTSGTQNSPYSQQLQATGGTGSLTWSLVTGTLPTGLNLSANGLLSGTPTGTGTSNFTIKVTDSCAPTAQTKQRAFSLTISAQIPPPVITTTSPLPAGTQGVSYSATMAATGGVTPYTWSVTGGSLPTGLSLSAAGAITGTPTTIGTYTATIQVTDSASHSASGSFSITISCVALAITTTSPLPPGTISTAYSAQMQSSGGTGGLTWALNSGSFPSGVSISSSGAISGTPSASGTFTPNIKVTDSCSTAQVASGPFNLTIAAAVLVIITTSPLPPGSVGQLYSVSLVATGGTTPYTWTLTSGSLPAGLSLSAGGVISGTPTTAAVSTFTVQVADSAAHTATQQYTITTPAYTVSLSWQETTAGATFNVQRATVSGGPYTTIATGVTGTSYLDVTVSPATTYYYVVTATANSQTSGKSNQASAVIP